MQVVTEAGSSYSSSSKTVSHVLVIIAMEAEAGPLISSLGYLTRVESDVRFAPFKIYSGQHESDCKVTVVTNGKDKRFGVDNVGTVPAAIAAFSTIHQFSPDIVINAGTAGGFKAKGACIGDVFLTTSVSNHDRRIPIPGFDAYGRGSYTSLQSSNIAKACSCKQGNLTTSNSLDHSLQDDAIMLENDASVKDMEGAAIAWVCEQAQVPYLGIKCVTDIVDGDRVTQEEFLENLHKASLALLDSVPKVIDYVLRKAIEHI